MVDENRCCQQNSIAHYSPEFSFSISVCYTLKCSKKRTTHNNDTQIKQKKQNETETHTVFFVLFDGIFGKQMSPAIGDRAHIALIIIIIIIIVMVV